MAYVVHNDGLAAPFSQIGETPTFETQVSDLHERAAIAGVFRNGSRPLKPEEVPYKLVLDKKRKALPGGFVTENGLFIVKGQVRDILEGLDPGVHQFFPIDVVYKGGSKPEDEYFVLNVTATQDSVVAESPGVAFRANLLDPRTIGPDDPEKMEFHHYKKDVMVRKSSLSGLNMWREPRYIASYLISNAFFEALKAQDLKLLRSYKTKEI